MSTDLIRYDLLAQEALRGVVKRVLADVARTGVPGEHHFYISFNTQYPGVRISPRLREKYPDEMTVILQHQFWDLAVTEHSFEVGLSFSNIPEKLFVPFEAITGFFDPSVKFGLKFETITQIASDKPEKPATPREAPKGARSEPQEAPPTKKKTEKSVKDAKDEPAAENGAQVVSLDKFRKK